MFSYTLMQSKGTQNLHEELEENAKYPLHWLKHPIPNNLSCFRACNLEPVACKILYERNRHSR